MVDRKDRIDESGFTEFADPKRPFGILGKAGMFFKKFFARDIEEERDENHIDPTTGRKVDAPKPLQGDAVQARDVIRVPSTVGSSKTSYPIIPQLEYDRRKRYREYEDMDGYPEISAAFDIYADDCSQENIDGSKWDIISDDDLIKDEISNLFETINLDRYLWDITRNAVKYGDNFLETIVDLDNIKRGVQRIKILNPNFIFRVEDEFGYLKKFLQEVPKKNEWTSYGGMGATLSDAEVIPLDPGQIVHFRLHTSDPTHYPYGKGIASSARATYKSLKMMEDAMLIYRLVRAPERRIFYIDTGSLPASKAEMHISKQMDKFKKNKTFNTQTGNIEESFNALAADEDFYIAVNGTQSGTKIETLPGADNLGEVDDVKYFRDKLLAALKVPKDYIVEKDSSPERKANLSQLDVKFARVVNRIQKSVEIGIETVAKRHLMLKRFPLSKINKLKIKLPAPSDMARKRQLDLDEQKARVVQAVKGLGIFPMEKLYKDYYQLNDQEIDKIKKELKKDQEDPVFQQIQALGEDPMMAGEPPMEEDMPGEQAAEPAENETPTSNESINFDELIELAQEAGSDDQLVSLLTEMRLEQADFNKNS
tara:strand:+ start:23423 stop:25207 length:1785 start_codon:yes stop_codon:yes gene_type:complete